MTTTPYWTTNTNDASGYLASTPIFSKRIRDVREPEGSFTVALDAQTSAWGEAITEPGVPGEWLEGQGSVTFTFRIHVSTGDTSISCSVHMRRVDSGGTIQALSSGPAGVDMSAGVHTYTLSMGLWQPGDRAHFEMSFLNNHTHNPASIVVEFASVEGEHEFPWVIPADPVYGYFDLDDDVDIEWVGTRASVGVFNLDDEVDVEWSGYAPVPEISPVALQDRTVTRTRSVVRLIYIVAPSGLTVWVVSGTELGVSWDPVPEASAYDLERDGVVILQDYELTEYLDEGLEMDVTYVYRVRSVL